MLFVCIFVTALYYVAHNSPKLTIGLGLQSAGVTGVCHLAQPGVVVLLLLFLSVSFSFSLLPLLELLISYQKTAIKQFWKVKEETYPKHGAERYRLHLTEQEAKVAITEVTKSEVGFLKTSIGELKVLRHPW